MGAVTVDYNLSQFGPNGALHQSGKQLTALSLLNQAFVPPTGYSQPKPLKYQTEIYNWRTQAWDIVPAYVAPPLCMNGLQPYTGGTIAAPLQFLQAISVGNSPNTMTCRQVSPGSPNGPVTATPFQSAVTPTTVRPKVVVTAVSAKRAVTPTPAPPVTATPVSRGQGIVVATVIISSGGYNYGGQILALAFWVTALTLNWPTISMRTAWYEYVIRGIIATLTRWFLSIFRLVTPLNKKVTTQQTKRPMNHRDTETLALPKLS